MSVIDYSNRNIYFISDLHLYHKNIITYCKRPFLDVEEMNKTIFENWNKTIKNDDLVFNLGDFVIGAGASKNEKARIIESELNGEKFFLKGNHDLPDMIPNKMILSYIHYITYKGLKIGMSHYPPKNKENRFVDIFVYGHSHHNKLDMDNDNIINVSVESINYTPISINEIIEKIIKRNS